ncbi:cyclin [Stagonosporopsis vannaccii]|nr:cyclin [Stagonosporopsis vannaccii]
MACRRRSKENQAAPDAASALACGCPESQSRRPCRALSKLPITSSLHRRHRAATSSALLPASLCTLSSSLSSAPGISDAVHVSRALLAQNPTRDLPHTKTNQRLPLLPSTHTLVQPRLSPSPPSPRTALHTSAHWSWTSHASDYRQALPSKGSSRSVAPVTSSLPPAIYRVWPVSTAKHQPGRGSTHASLTNMSQVRSTRQRAVTNENDENAGPTRMTRAKAAGLNATEHAGDVPKKTVVTKKSAATLNGATRTRTTRSALGDVSNTMKGDGIGAGAKDGKKPAATKGALARAARPTGVQKPSQAEKTRQSLPAKPTNKRIAPPDANKPAGKKQKPPPMEQDTEEEEENVVPKEEEEAKTKKQVAKIEPVEEEPKTKREEVEVFEDDFVDLDKEDIDDPLMVSEYVVEIFEYLKELEIATMANPDYMDSQNELEWKMRGILVDWLLEVHTRFRLLPETLFLAVNIIDRFLSTKIVQLDRLQLVGVTAMFIASKYEEVLSPHVQNFRHVADDGFTEEEILSAERFVLSALNYDLSYPNPMNFLRRISKADNYDIQTRTLGKYLLEIGCLDHRFLAHPPSQVAAAAMYLARLVLERGPWDSTLAHYSGYSEDEIQPVLHLMIDYLASPVLHEAFFKKYASKKFLKASIVLRKWAKEYVLEYGNALHEESSQPRSKR